MDQQRQCKNILVAVIKRHQKRGVGCANGSGRANDRLSLRALHVVFDIIDGLAVQDVVKRICGDLDQLDGP